MSTPAASIAPRSALSPIAMSPAGSPEASGNSVSVSTPRPITMPKIGQSSPGVTQIITSKEWVLPPRPKPGRKPSVDTPASKRKAQNRAAQRAFRERRATRVQELEEKLMEVEKEKEIKEMGLVNTINKLKVENQFLLKNLDQLRNEVNGLKESTQSQSQSHPQQQQYQLSFKPTYNLGGGNSASNSSPTNHGTGSPASSAFSVQQISPAPSTESPPSFSSHNLRTVSSSSTFTPQSSNNTPEKHHGHDNNFDCGVCLKDECLCETVGLKPTQNEVEINKKLEDAISSFKPMPAVSLKKKRKATTEQNGDDGVLEIDFTKKFASQAKAVPQLKKLKKSPQKSNTRQLESNSHFNEDSPVDDCGFCSDDTPCVCREAAKEAARLNDSLNEQSHQNHSHMEEDLEDQNKQLPPILNSNRFRNASLPVMHPGPSVEIREITNLSAGAVPTVLNPTTRITAEKKSTVEENADTPGKNPDGGCTGNPGTCQQCQMDPMSTLFCTTVANKAQDDSKVSPPAKNTASPQPMISRTNSKASLPSITVGSMTNPSTPSSSAPPPLIATNNPATSTSGMFIPCADAYKTLSRHKKFNSVDFSTLVGKLTTRGMQVEVQSVANVLRELDRRVYN